MASFIKIKIYAPICSKLYLCPYLPTSYLLWPNIVHDIPNLLNTLKTLSQMNFQDNRKSLVQTTQNWKLENICTFIVAMTIYMNKSSTHELPIHNYCTLSSPLSFQISTASPSLGPYCLEHYSSPDSRLTIIKHMKENQKTHLKYVLE